MKAWLQSAATCPGCRRELYQPEEEETDQESEDESDNESEDESEYASDEESDDARAERLEAERRERDRLYEPLPFILGYENIDFSSQSSDFWGLRGFHQGLLIEGVQDWLNIVEPHGEYRFRNQHIGEVYVDTEVLNILVHIILWLKEDTQDGRFTLEEVCREDWALVGVAANDAIMRCKGWVLEAEVFRARIALEVENRQHQANRPSPRYAECVFQDQEPGPRQSFEEQVDYLVDILVDYSKDGYRPGVTWPDNAAALEGVRIDMYELVDGLKAFEAYEEENNFVLSDSLHRQIALPDDSESFDFWQWNDGRCAALLRIKPDPPLDATDEAIARDDWCGRDWAIVEEITETLCSGLESTMRLSGREMTVSGFVDTLWEAMRQNHGKHWYWYNEDPGVQLDLGWSTNGRFPSYGEAYEGTSTFEKDMERLFTYMAYTLMREYEKKQAALPETNEAVENGPDEEDEAGSTDGVPSGQLRSLSLSDEDIEEDWGIVLGPRARSNDQQ